LINLLNLFLVNMKYRISTLMAHATKVKKPNKVLKKQLSPYKILPQKK